MIIANICLPVVIIVLASSVFGDPVPNANESIDAFDKEFGIIEDAAAKKQDESKLKNVEKEIQEENLKFKSGASTYFEKLNPESVLSKDEFEGEREGLVPEKAPTLQLNFERHNIPGLLPVPENETYDEENILKLEELYKSIDRASIPDSYSSKDLGLVTPPKDQRTCGSCAAFASTGLHETCMIKAGSAKDSMDLSEQHLVDCAFNPRNGINGCKGASPSAYPKWFQSQGGIGVHENSYAYSGNRPLLFCPYSTLKLWQTGSKVSDVMVDYWCNEDKLKTLVATYGAALVGIYASDRGFSNYGGGIFSQCSVGQNMNHAVLIIGYGTENGVDYWLGKNSWGTRWGESGFFRLRRGTNECGVSSICVAATCTGGLTAEPAPLPPPPPPIPKSLTCDVSNSFGPITGTYTIKVGGSGVVSEYVSTVTCQSGVCKPSNPEGIENCCVYICGETSC